MERASGGRGRELEVASLSRGGDLNLNQCHDRGKTFGRLEGPSCIEVVGASMVVSVSGWWAPRCVATRFFVRTSRVGRGICRVREIDGVRDIRAIGSCTETTRNNAWGGRSRAPSPPSSGSEIGPIRSGQNSPGPVTTGQRASRRAARSSWQRGATLFRVSPNVAPGWGNTLVPVENTKPIPIPEPMLPIPGPAYASPTPHSTPSSPSYVPGDLPANPDEAYMAWLRRVMPSEREEAAIVEYTRRLESGEEVQRELVVPEE